MKGFRSTVAVAISTLMLAGSAFAGVKDDIVASGAGYGKAGCGLGGLLVKQNNWFQIFAVTLNGIGSQTFAISTGTSGCDGGIVGGEMSSKRYIETNREVLAKDIARGEGETLAGLAVVAGCKDAALLGRSLQAQYSNIFTSATLSDSDVGENVVSAIRMDSSLACTL